jgi:hypothetical protein
MDYTGPAGGKYQYYPLGGPVSEGTFRKENWGLYPL